MSQSCSDLKGKVGGKFINVAFPFHLIDSNGPQTSFVSIGDDCFLHSGESFDNLLSYCYFVLVKEI